MNPSRKIDSNFTEAICSGRVCTLQNWTLWESGCAAGSIAEIFGERGVYARARHRLKSTLAIGSTPEVEHPNSL
jgi:hypothetical protein